MKKDKRPMRMDKKTSSPANRNNMANPEILAKVRAILSKDPTAGRYKVAQQLGMSENTARLYLTLARVGDYKQADTPSLIKAAIAILKNAMVTPRELSEALGCTLGTCNDLLEALERTHSLKRVGALLTLAPQSSEKINVSTLMPDDGWIRFGLVSDTHIGNRGFRKDAAEAIYDIFEQEGVEHVYLAGNPIDGFLPNINLAEVVTPTPEGQARLFASLMPRRKGISTFFITGDDHEGWWSKAGFNIGAYIQQVAQNEGRDDLVYIGHVESDVALHNSSGEKTFMKVMHPGGGSSYARSYVAQKLVESLQGGEKPAVCVMGHYHVHGYFIERNCHVIMMPGLADQTIFARKKRLRYEVGGAVVELKLDANGAVARFRLEWIPFFDRGYYREFLENDSKSRTNATEKQKK